MQDTARGLPSKFEKNQTGFEDYELSALLGHVLLRQDTKPLAKDLLIRFKSLRGVLAAPLAELREIKGFGPSLGTFCCLREVNARCAETRTFDKDTLITGKDVAAVARERLAGVAHEELWGAYVDNQNRLISWRKLAEGMGNRLFVHNAAVIAPALELKATGIILVHNHPGGSPQPSPADIELTRTLSQAANGGCAPARPRYCDRGRLHKPCGKRDHLIPN